MHLSKLRQAGNRQGDGLGHEQRALAPARDELVHSLRRVGLQWDEPPTARHIHVDRRKSPSASSSRPGRPLTLLRRDAPRSHHHADLLSG
jgi:hypothetical protein